MMNAAPYTAPATLPSPPTIIIARYWIETSMVNRSQVTVSV
jgi:hypothetical protein